MEKKEVDFFEDYEWIEIVNKRTMSRNVFLNTIGFTAGHVKKPCKPIFLLKKFTKTDWFKTNAFFV